MHSIRGIGGTCCAASAAAFADALAALAATFAVAASVCSARYRVANRSCVTGDCVGSLANRPENIHLTKTRDMADRDDASAVKAFCCTLANVDIILNYKNRNDTREQKGKVNLRIARLT